MRGIKSIDRAFKNLGKRMEKTFTGSTAEERRGARRERDEAVAKADTDKLAAAAAESTRVAAEAKAAVALANKQRIDAELVKAQADLDALLKEQPKGTVQMQSKRDLHTAAASASETDETQKSDTPGTAAESLAGSIAAAKAKLASLQTAAATAAVTADTLKAAAADSAVLAHASQAQADTSQRAAEAAIQRVNSINNGGVASALRGAMTAFSNGLEKATNCLSGALKEGLKFVCKAVDAIVKVGVMLVMNSPIMLLVKLAAPDVAKKIGNTVEAIGNAVGSVVKDTLTAAVNVVESAGKTLTALTRGDFDLAGKSLTSGVMSAAMVAATVGGGIAVLGETALVAGLSGVLPPAAAGALAVVGMMNARGLEKKVLQKAGDFIPTSAIDDVAGHVVKKAGSKADEAAEASGKLAQKSSPSPASERQMSAAELDRPPGSSKSVKEPTPNKADKHDGPKSKRSEEDNKNNKDEEFRGQRSEEKHRSDDRDSGLQHLGLNQLASGGMVFGSLHNLVEQKHFLASYSGNIAEASRSDPSEQPGSATTAIAKLQNKMTSVIQGAVDSNLSQKSKPGAKAAA